MATDDDEYEFEHGTFKYPKGSTPDRSRENPDAWRGTLRDADGHLSGHAEFIPGREDDEYYWQPENEPDSQETPSNGGWLEPLVALGVLFAAAKAAPHVTKWVSDFKAKRKGGSIATHEVESEVEVASISAIPVADFANAVDIALDDHRTMSSAEAEQRILEIMLAAAVIAENMRALSGAQIEDGASHELQAAMDKLTVPQVTESLNRMLESNSSLLDDEVSTAFSSIFGGGQIVDGQYVPLENDDIKEALRLSPREAEGA